MRGLESSGPLKGRLLLFIFPSTCIIYQEDNPMNDGYCNNTRRYNTRGHALLRLETKGGRMPNGSDQD